MTESITNDQSHSSILVLIWR